jgi:hypothetical protein
MLERIIYWLDKYFKGNVVIGQATAPSSGMQVTVAGNVGPEATSTRSIGATALRWAQAWFSDHLNVGVVNSTNSGLVHTTSNTNLNHIVGDHANSGATHSVKRRSRRSRGTITAPTTVAAFDFIREDISEADAGAGYLEVVKETTYVVTRAASNNVSGAWAIATRPPGAGAALIGRLGVQDDGSVVVGDQATALATTATAGFLYIPSCAGVPTGVPVVYTGTVPLIYDTTNLRLYVYSGGAWRIH